MSNVNDYQFAKMLDIFQAKVIEPQVKKIADALKIIGDPNHTWKDEEQKQASESRLKNYKEWLQFYQKFHEEGMTLVKQHETLVNNLSKWYDKWYADISNNGRQEKELMSVQADMLNEIFCEIYKELLPLKLEGMKAPKPLNLK